MPLSKARNKERMRVLRATCVQPNDVLPVQPKPTIQGLKIGGNRILGLTNEAVQPTKTIPIYNPNKQYAPGDKVLVKPMYGKSKKLVEATIPSIDADGNPIPDY